MLQKIEKLIQKLKEKGQGVVEYAMILGFVAILAIWFLNKSALTTKIEQNVSDVTDAADKIHTSYTTASSSS